MELGVFIDFLVAMEHGDVSGDKFFRTYSLLKEYETSLQQKED